MKTTTFVAAAILAATMVSSAPSQETTRTDNIVPVFGKASSYKEADITKIEKYYLASLNYPIDAIVEGTIGEVTRLKLAQMCCTSNRIRERLQDLSHESRSPAIRYKAILALMVFEHPEYFADEAARDYMYAEELFGAVAHRLEKELLVAAVQ
jgi:hypothetical protein